MSQDQRTIEECTSGRDFIAKSSIRQSKSVSHLPSMKVEKPTDALKRIPGNDKCADCGAPDPDWASLNLGILICIECSGIHRKFGVHISKASQLSSLYNQASYFCSIILLLSFSTLSYVWGRKPY